MKCSEVAKKLTKQYSSFASTKEYYNVYLVVNVFPSSVRSQLR